MRGQTEFGLQHLLHFLNRGKNMQKRSWFFVLSLITADYLALWLAGVLAYWIRLFPSLQKIRQVQFGFSFEQYLLILSATGLLIIVIFAAGGIYRHSQRFYPFNDIFRSFTILTVTIVALIAFSYFIVSPFASRFIIITAWVLSLVSLSLGRLTLQAIYRTLLRSSRLPLRNTIIIGRDHTTKNLERYLRENPDMGYKVVALIEKPDVSSIQRSIKRTGRVDDVILGEAKYAKKKVFELVNYCSINGIKFHFVPNPFEVATIHFRLNTILGIPIISVSRSPLEGWGAWLKRIFDLTVALTGLIILSPLFLLIALAIKWDSAGPVFARIRQRVGSGGRPFYMYKFRSMVRNADQLKELLLPYNQREGGKGPLFKIRDDPRVTRVGRFLRRYRLDELPQLLNVLRGEMSLVGPRAHEPQEVAKYKKEQKFVLSVKPGITGLAQISGSSDLPFEEENKLDVFYIEHWSFWLDIKILLRTIFFLFRDRSAI